LNTALVVAVTSLGIGGFVFEFLSTLRERR
jgi:hypothetical protein